MTSLPFYLKRSDDMFDNESFTSTREIIHGLLRLADDELHVQWRLERRTESYGMKMRTEQEIEDVRELVVPLSGVAGARVHGPWWSRLTGPLLILQANDLKAFERLAGQAGLRLDHPTQFTFRIRRADRLAAEEFVADLALAIARRASPDRDASALAPDCAQAALEPPGRSGSPERPPRDRSDSMPAES